MSSIIVANTILYHFVDNEIEVNHIKLQCLVYLLFKAYAKRTERKLFNEPFEVYKHGPVLPSVCYHFQGFGNDAITSLAHDAKGKVQVVDLYKDKNLWDVWCTFLLRYKDCDAVELSRIVRLPGSAWDKAMKNGYSVLRFEDILLDCYSD